MSLTKLNQALESEIAQLEEEGRAKAPERVIVDYIPPKDQWGPRYKLQDSNQEFIRLNSNSYLSLSNHPDLIEAADEATEQFGVGPGAVRFIDGTFKYHTELERSLAQFVQKPAAKIFNSAYTANLGLALTINRDRTYWIGDELNHNSIIRAMRIGKVPSENKGIYSHNDMDGYRECLSSVPSEMERVIVIFDGIFSMRGDYAPIDEIVAIASEYDEKFKDGVITVVDDSHGIGAYGPNGRGTADFTDTQPDIIVGTMGKAFGVNGGFIAGSESLIEAARQKADTYIYTNPLSQADCAAAIQAVEIASGKEGRQRLQSLKDRTQQFRDGLESLGFETINGPHPIVPLVVRDTERTHSMVSRLFEKGVLVVGLTFPVVPRGDETIRFQISAAHTEADIDYVLGVLGEFA
ncbi:MAG: aminotransferase class I/II-fold pyridoxal phosphate-dependent enzyme [Candidatus Marinimicrobia bacterium]|nr:aminotransferase class I/II-fold pyridoxal phosphate-dependent enzyme [Candidatus Neomarinimicrobiota bacterium]MCF7830304.1 aminotransferase class I/II-fold pyridoxal phosphate-dependent enzyme [Candidatus Neomarinimicrobiota bacterium]MCF7882460.1 aminotransferase class I/II-fold pyridoxal phosphate-dependent enzyme [Candidatus Neomarinimicrobiota bacterium]